MDEIVARIAEVSRMIAEVSSAVSTQADSVNGVRATVTHLDEMTARNAALVEQYAAAAQSMSDQARRMHELVGVFRV
jgi:methyl-accepting chemotaxis protein